MSIAATPVARKTKEPGMTKRPGAQSGDVEKTNENTISSGNKTRAEIVCSNHFHSSLLKKQ